MALDQELKALMNDTISLELATGTLNKWAEPEFLPAITVQCYLVHNNIEALDKTGRQVTATVQAILAQPELDVNTEARITLDDGDVRSVIQVLRAKDETGDDYYLEIRA